MCVKTNLYVLGRCGGRRRRGAKPFEEIEEKNLIIDVFIICSSTKMKTSNFYCFP